MKTLLTTCIAGLLFCSASYAAVWDYDYGSGTGAFTTSGTSVSFLPTTETNGGTARVRIGSTGGSFNLENPGNVNIGTDTELRIVAPTSASVNKFSIFDYTAATSFSLKFDIRMTGGSSGIFYFLNGDGASFNDNNAISSAQIFSGLRWTYGASSAITTAVRSGGSWVTTGLPATPFVQNVTYTVEIFGNNSASTINYTYGGAQSVAANTWDLWIGGTKVSDDLAKGALGNAANIDSFMFYGESSTGNVAQLILDNMSYANAIVVIPEPSTAMAIVIGGALLVGMRRKSRVA